MPPVGFEPAIPAKEKPETYALDRAATGTALCFLDPNNFLVTVRLVISVVDLCLNLSYSNVCSYLIYLTDEML
jgi:hypothetical protein